MLQLKLVPELYYFDTFKAFNEQFKLGKGDILITNEWMYKPYVEPLGIKDMPVIFQEKFGAGEPSDQMMQAMIDEMKKYQYDRIVAFGGGTIIDICKVLALKTPKSVEGLYMGEEPAVKEKTTILIPTTCGTGSEVTNVAVASLVNKGLKKGIATPATYGDIAVLIPESLEGLPDYVFSTSSIDALVHATESYVSPKATIYTRTYSELAIRMILDGYKKIVAKGGNNKENRKEFLKDFILAANIAGVAFSVAGCGPVHALAYSIGGAFHVAHGESNYAYFTEVFKMYMKKAPKGETLVKLNQIYSEVLGCKPEEVWDKVPELLDQILTKKSLSAYGTTEAQKAEFAQSTIDNQQRLLGNEYVHLTYDDLYEIICNLY